MRSYKLSKQIISAEPPAPIIKSNPVNFLTIRSTLDLLQILQLLLVLLRLRSNGNHYFRSPFFASMPHIYNFAILVSFLTGNNPWTHCFCTLTSTYPIWSATSKIVMCRLCIIVYCRWRDRRSEFVGIPGWKCIKEDEPREGDPKARPGPHSASGRAAESRWFRPPNAAKCLYPLWP